MITAIGILAAAVLAYLWGWAAGQNLMAGQIILALQDVEPERAKRQALIQRLLHIRGAQVSKPGSRVKDLEQ